MTARLATGLAALVLAHAPLLAQTPDTPPPPLPPQARVLVDTTGLMSLAQARERFEAGEGRPADPSEIMPTGKGGALWYQLVLPVVASSAHMVLAVPQTGLDSVDLYQSLPDGVARRWQLQRSGDAVAVDSWPVRHLYPAFDLLLMPQDREPVYLRVEHGYPTSVSWTLTGAATFQEQSKQWHLLLGVYLGLVLLVLLVSVVQAVSGRDPVHLLYAAYVLVLALGQLALTGLAGEYLWAASAWWNDLAPVTLGLVSAAMLHWLLRRLALDRDMGGLPWLLAAMAGLALVLALGLLLAGRQWVFLFVAPYFLISMVTHLAVAAWYAWRTPRVGLWVLGGVTCVVVGGMFPVARLLGLMPGSMATQYGAQIGGALEIPLLMVGLYFRSRERRDNQVRMGSLARVDPLTGLASHRVLMRRLEHLLSRQQRDPLAGAVMRIRLGNVLDIRQEYGMEAAESAVVYAGACIASMAQEGDTVGRHKDGDFVLVLQGHISRAQLTAMGQQLIVRGLASSPDLPPQTTLQLKLAVAESPFRTNSTTMLLQSLGSVLEDLGNRPGTALRFVSDGTAWRNARMRSAA